MRKLLAGLMISNAALFFFGAIQHAGIAIGPFHEPQIVPAAIVETICGLALIGGIIALLETRKSGWFAAVIGNLVATAGVLLGMIALARGAGPRTASNDLYHRVMLVLAAAALLLLFLPQQKLIRTSGAGRKS